MEVMVPRNGLKSTRHERWIGVTEKEGQSGAVVYGHFRCRSVRASVLDLIGFLIHDAATYMQSLSN